MTISRDAAARRENARQSTGEFGEHARSAPELSLDAAPSEVVGEATIRYTQRDVIPPRARKPRDVELEATVPVRVAVVDAEDAPVALTMSSSRWDPQGDGVIQIRTIDGRMFRPVEDRDGQHQQVTSDTVGQLHRGYRDETYPAHATDQFIRASLERNANTDLEGYRVIDGALWQATGTPAYKVEVYGFGHSADVRQDLYIGEPGPLPHGYYAPHEYDLAVTEARSLCGNDDARARFDERLPDVGPMTLTEAYTPDTRHRTPPRVEYPEPYTLDRDYGRPGNPPRRQADLDEAWGKLRDGLLAHPGAVIEVDDGFGGTTRTIDRDVVSAKQARDFDEFQGMYAALRAPRT
jgi:hypothetical protein